MKPLNIIVIGLGKQCTEDHLPAIKESELFNLLAVADPVGKKTAAVAEEYGVPGYMNSGELIREWGNDADVALIAVPHNEYIPIIKQLSIHKIDVIKEKPFATSIAEANVLKAIIERSNISVYVTLQRRFNPIFTTFKQLLKRVGKVYSIEGRYTMNISRLDEGWRANKQIAGGGALMDMGYHFVDLIVWYFGLPDSITCKLSSGNRENQIYDVEDTALINFTYNDTGEDEGRILGNAIISRVYPQKEESLTAYGTKGSVRVQRGKVCRMALDGSEIEVLERLGSWPSAPTDQLEEFALRIMRKKDHPGDAIPEKIKHFKHIAFIEAAYDSNKNHDARDPKKYLTRMVGENE